MSPLCSAVATSAPATPICFKSCKSLIFLTPPAAYNRAGFLVGSGRNALRQMGFTPKEERVFDEKILHSWVKNSIAKELEEKGLKKSDTADLIVSYIIGAVELSETGDLGPFGGTPGIETNRRYTNSFRQGNLVIDLNDKRDFLIWRVNAQAVNMSPQAERYIIEVVAKGFRKFSIKPKKSKKK